METVPKIEHREKKKILKINFLVHPGYDMRFDGNIENPQELLDLYIRKAEAMGNDELMFAFPFVLNFKNDVKREEAYVETLNKIRDVLGDRLIVITDVGNITINADTAARSWDKIKRIAEARGYYFDSDVESDAFGEYCRNCVSKGAANLNIAAGLNKRTNIESEFTELSQAPEDRRRTFRSEGSPFLEENLKSRLKNK